MEKSETKQDKKTIFEWLKAHKKELAIAGASIAGVIITIIAIKNRAELKKYWDELQTAISKLSENKQSKIIVNSCDTTNMKTLSEAVDSVELPVAVPLNHITANKMAFDVQKHIRNLPQGYHPSLEKIETALENGVELAPNQTWVRDYKKGLEAA